mmetsp:Transcript_26647/g.38957  ORF Transcript_26647/g.38957 Transcript_26647/m.38957 type:complete len:158 (+) Transcript_26647:1407-1880(+)
MQDRFEEAFRMYRKAKMPDQSHRLIMELSKNAVVMQLFGDVSHYHWFIATEMLRDDATVKSKAFDESERINMHNVHIMQSQRYCVYSYIHEFCNEVFVNMHNEMLLHAAAFLVNVIKFNDVPRGISLVSVLYTLAKQAIFWVHIKLLVLHTQNCTVL